MTSGSYPLDLVKARLVNESIPTAHRIMWLEHIAKPLGFKPSPSRFCDGTLGYAVIYAAPSFETAFIETVVRDRFVWKANRDIPLADVMARCWANLSTKKDKKRVLLDLRGTGCVDLGASTDAVNAHSHSASRALSRAIYKHHKDVDGFLYPSRLTGADCYAVFDRAVPKLESEEEQTPCNVNQPATLINNCSISHMSTS